MKPSRSLTRFWRRPRSIHSALGIDEQVPHGDVQPSRAPALDHLPDLLLREVLPLDLLLWIFHPIIRDLYQGQPLLHPSSPIRPSSLAFFRMPLIRLFRFFMYSFRLAFTSGFALYFLTYAWWALYCATLFASSSSSTSSS